MIKQLLVFFFSSLTQVQGPFRNIVQKFIFFIYLLPLDTLCQRLHPGSFLYIILKANLFLYILVYLNLFQFNTAEGSWVALIGGGEIYWSFFIRQKLEVFDSFYHTIFFQFDILLFGVQNQLAFLTL